MFVSLPFAHESFDIIYSVGVLRRADCEAAVKALDKYLKPGWNPRCLAL